MRLRQHLVVCLALLAAACGVDSTDPEQSASRTVLDQVRVDQNNPQLAMLGERIFLDKNLSIGKNQSCSSCHDPAFGFSSPDGNVNAHGAVMEGSIAGRFAIRRPPSAAYAMAPVFFYDAVDDAFVGGNFWDGRATGGVLGIPSADQALLPFVGPSEQGLPDAACVVHRISIGAYAARYRQVWGNQIATIAFPANTDALCSSEGNTIPLSPADRQKAEQEYQHVALSIASYESSSRVSPFRSRFDAFRHGQGTMTQQEKDGFVLFKGKAGCAACHPSAGNKPFFTDFTYDNIGVPANPENPALLAYGFVDRGLGVTLGDPGLDGAQKVATLRNLTRGTPGVVKSYMHNGVFKSLEQVVHFYNTRDVLPQCAAGIGPNDPDFGVTCWPPPEVLENVNQEELGNLGLTATEEAAVVAFLKTLDDM
jgi:cytochrome c peroxidase